MKDEQAAIDLANDLPIGSGYGRELSELGIDEFVNKKLIRVSALTDPF